MSKFRPFLVLSTLLLMGLRAAPVPAALVVQGLDQRLATAARVLDLRRGALPPDLDARQLPPRSRAVLSNPYAPLDWKFLSGVADMACHPQGGLVLWARTQTLAADGRSYRDNGAGLWRVEADGRVRPLAVAEQGVRTRQLCNAPANEVQLPDLTYPISIAVEPGGDVIVADTWNFALRRFRQDGFVEQFAGGGDDLCTRRTWESGRHGYRDGPAEQALFSGNLSIATGADGAILVAEAQRAYMGTPGNCSLRRVDRAGTVSTLLGNGTCPDYATISRTAGTSVTFDQVAADARGTILVLGAERGLRNPASKSLTDVVFTKVHRVNRDGSTTLLGRAGWGASFDPEGQLAAVGFAPDGRPLAFNIAYGQIGLVEFSGPKNWSLWWAGMPARAGSDGRPDDAPLDGPRTQARLLDVHGFCTATDGFLYLRESNAIRRIDPASGEVTTWLR